MAKGLPNFFAGFLSLCLLLGVLGIFHTASGWVSVTTALLLVFAGKALSSRLNHLTKKSLTWLIILSLGLMLIGQLWVLANLPVTVYHDPFRVLAQADQMAGGDWHWRITYFWRYANNVPLAVLLTLWLKAGLLLHLTTNQAVALLSLLTLDGFIALSLKTIWQLSRRPSVTLGALTFFTCTPFAYTYYLQVFYSDLPVMLMLLVVFRILWHWPAPGKKRLLSAAILVLAALMAALLKPSFVVILPALLILLLLSAKKHPLNAKRLLLPAVLIALGIGLSSPAAKALDHFSGYTPKTEFALPASHWLMMGLNASSGGTYASADVRADLALPTKAARQHYDTGQIKTRLTQLGPVGLLRLWAKKLVLLLNGHGIANWYNGGLRSGPARYLAHVNFFSQLTAISYTAATIALFLLVSIRLWLWRPAVTQKNNITLLAVLTALGYLAFHTLLWEAEARYGQVILPLLLLILAALPAPAATKVSSKWALAAPLLPLAVSLGGSVFLAQTPTKQIIAAQRSQLSRQYQAKPVSVASGTRLSENVVLNHEANYFSVQIHAQSNVQVQLIRHSVLKSYRLADTGGIYRLYQHLAAGRYQIVIINQKPQPQAVDVVHTQNYKLAAHPLVINGKALPTASLIFTCMSLP